MVGYFSYNITLVIDKKKSCFTFMVTAGAQQIITPSVPKKKQVILLNLACAHVASGHAIVN